MERAKNIDFDDLLSKISTKNVKNHSHIIMTQKKSVLNNQTNNSSNESEKYKKLVSFFI